MIRVRELLVGERSIQWIVGGVLVVFWILVIALMDETTRKQQLNRSEASLPTAFRDLPRPESFRLTDDGCFELRRSPSVFVSCFYTSSDTAENVAAFYRSHLRLDRWKPITTEETSLTFEDGVTGSVLVSMSDGKYFVYVIEKVVPADQRIEERKLMYGLVFSKGRYF